ncbi:hypothetical protein GCM10028817_44120 [Spirosoma pomorum]
MILASLAEVILGVVVLLETTDDQLFLFESAEWEGDLEQMRTDDIPNEWFDKR